jgi:hypothetical protein
LGLIIYRELPTYSLFSDGQDKDKNRSARLSVGGAKDVEQNVDNSEVLLDKAFLINIPVEVQVSSYIFSRIRERRFDCSVFWLAPASRRPGND